MSEHCASHVGVLELLMQLHTWPGGLDANPQWYSQTRQVLVGITAQHARDAQTQGMTSEEHICKVMAVPG